MASFSFVLCVLLFSQGVFGGPAGPTGSEGTKTESHDGTKVGTTTATVTLGTQLSGNMNDNLLKALDNVRSGVMEISTPMVKFGTETIPGLFNNGFQTMTGTSSKIINGKKIGFGKILNGAGTVAGGGAVLASSVAGANMQFMGLGMGVTGNLIGGTAKMGLKLTGNLPDTTALSNMLFANITKGILNGVGGGFNAVGTGVNALSQGTAKVIDAIGNSVSHSISDAQDTMAKWVKSGAANIQDGAITFTTEAQLNYYKSLDWYLQSMLKMESVMDKLTEAINASGKKTSSSGDKTSSSGTKVDETKVDETKVDETEIDETKVDETKVDETKVDETKVDETKVNETEVDESKVDETKVDETEVDETKVDETKVDETKVDETKVGETKVDETAAATNNA